MASRHFDVREDAAEADISIWKEAFFGAEMLLLHASPVFYGLGIPPGDGSAVVLIPGFLGTDLYLSHLRSWLNRIGYRAYLSGIPLNADCPNLLIKSQVTQAVDTALWDTDRKVHLIGHSLGGIMARSFAAQRADDVASVITLAAPFRGTVLQRSVMHATEGVRRHILDAHGSDVLPQCYTPRCTCDFVNSLRRQISGPVQETAIFTRDDGIVDWRYCRTGDDALDFEVSGTHIGLVFNPQVYSIIARRLADAQTDE